MEFRMRNIKDLIIASILIMSLMIILLTSETEGKGSHRHKSSIPDSLRKPDSSLMKFQLDLGATNTNLKKYNFWGFDIELKYKYLNGLYTGILFNISETKLINDNFNKIDSIPELSYFDLGWVNQYNIINDSSVRINLNLTSGLEVNTLSDKSIQEKHTSRTKHGTKTYYDSKTISTNYFLLLQPGIDLSVKIYKIWFLSFKARYRWNIGAANFGRTEDFSDYSFFLGFSFMK
jgi:hypothetical protein